MCHYLHLITFSATFYIWVCSVDAIFLFGTICRTFLLQKPVYGSGQHSFQLKKKIQVMFYFCAHLCYLEHGK